MPIDCKYLQTNLTVKDIERMQAFYVEVFGCVPLRKIDHLTGKWIEDITSVENGEIKYVHLRFPGYGNNGPELELIQYLDPTKKFNITPNTYGLGHLVSKMYIKHSKRREHHITTPSGEFNKRGDATDGSH